MKKLKQMQGNHYSLTLSLREPDAPCTKSMEVSQSRMERVKSSLARVFHLSMSLLLNITFKLHRFEEKCSSARSLVHFHSLH